MTWTMDLKLFPNAKIKVRNLKRLALTVGSDFFCLLHAMLYCDLSDSHWFCILIDFVLIL